MIQFPGEKYRFYYRHGPMSKNILRDLGITRFWLSTESDNRYWKSHTPDNWEELIDCRTLPPNTSNPKTCPDTVYGVNPRGQILTYGVWSMTNHTEMSLYEKCAKYKHVLINFDMHNKTYVAKYYKFYAERIRWILNARDKFPGTVMIHYGAHIFDAAYCLGLDGSFSKLVARAPIQRVTRPDGSTIAFETALSKMPSAQEILGDWKYLLEDYPTKSLPFFYFKMQMMIPEFLQEYYARENMIQGYEIVDFDEHEIFFGYIFKNSRITPDKVWGPEKLKFNKQGYYRGHGPQASKPKDMPTIVKGDLTKKFTWNDATFCDSCSLNYCCFLYEKGGACKVPDSDGVRFSKKFSSGNAQDILDGMGMLLEKRAMLVHNRMKDAEDSGEPLEKEDTAAMRDLFKDSAQLAKLRDPNLTRPQVAVQVNHNQHGVALPPMPGQEAISAAQQISDREYASAIRELEAHGFQREKITQQMIEEFIRTKGEVLNSQPQLGMENPSVYTADDVYEDAELVEDDPGKQPLVEDRITGAVTTVEEIF
ncbi:terminase small subunit [Gordonia phage Jumbo]|uniref:Terminase small subunit n=1 Tax=Gordonia phage Jumbo TaxID=1887650 RepID=A0A1B3B0G4_9CAUD|nr:terminase small subunit [Gordonia phage Jumbo]AOE44520.1 terminase small subunit [Gordonia phage Jumbo]